MINISSDRPDRQRKLSWRGVYSIIAWEETCTWADITKGETYILMLRFKAEPDVPYITVEIDAKNPRILQWYGDKEQKTE